MTAKRAAAYEGGPQTRFFYIRRNGDLSQPMLVNYIVGGKAKQGEWRPSVACGAARSPPG